MRSSMSLIACLLLVSSSPFSNAGDAAAPAGSFEKSPFLLRRRVEVHKVGVQHEFASVGDAIARANITREELLERLEARSKAMKSRGDSSSASDKAQSKDSPFAAYRDALRTSGMTKQEIAACLTRESTDASSSSEADADAGAVCAKLRLMHTNVAMSKKQLRQGKGKKKEKNKNKNKNKEKKKMDSV